jgi:hypothetical protein
MAISSAQKKQLLKVKGMKQLKREYERQMKGAGMSHMKGQGFWDSIKKAVGDVNSWLKRTRAISTAGKIAGAILPFTPAAGLTSGVKKATRFAESKGYGKKTLTRDGRIVKNVMPTHPNIVRGGSRQIRQGVFNTVSSEFGKIKF